MTDRAKTEPSNDAEDAPAGVAGGRSYDWLTPEPAKETRRTTLLAVRLKPDERARVDQAAEALDLTASAYVRSRLLGPRPDVVAWRAAYQALLSGVENARAKQLAPEALEVLREIQDEFESIAATVFSQPKGDG